MGDFRHGLRKIAFPQCAGEALQVINKLIHNGAPKSLELANELLEEFVLCENTPGSREKKQLNSMEELQLLDLVCNYSFSSILRNNLFLFLFPVENVRRTPLLVKLVSMAVATKSTHVLSAAGMWLEQNGCNSPNRLTLAKSIVNDYLVLAPEAFKQLQDLPYVAPEFAANLLAAFAECYSSTDKDLTPPPALLRVVAFWANYSRGLCTSAPSAFTGLVRWCVTASLLGCEASDSYSQLHLALLESIIFSATDSLVTASGLACLAGTIQRLLPSAQHNDAQLAIDRFTQITIVLLRTGKVSGNLGELCQQMDLLPRNELLECFSLCRSIAISPPYFRLRS